MGTVLLHQSATPCQVYRFFFFHSSCQWMGFSYTSTSAALNWKSYYIIISSSTLGNPCSTTFHMCITQIDLNSNVGLSPSVWEIELTITMASEVMSLFITQEAKALIEASKMFFFCISSSQVSGEKECTYPTNFQVPDTTLPG